MMRKKRTVESFQIHINNYYHGINVEGFAEKELEEYIDNLGQRKPKIDGVRWINFPFKESVVKYSIYANPDYGNVDYPNALPCVGLFSFKLMFYKN